MYYNRNEIITSKYQLLSSFINFQFNILTVLKHAVFKELVVKALIKYVLLYRLPFISVYRFKCISIEFNTLMFLKN